ncbi:major facilitator superfamily protein [Artemisia annua]|uniref:Major facilitator superfamily protein n=1 Tax=Artemisia annua TaxID=35608 RepID=A0A2U1LE40_ARTAN|nr:major facilitator superfamily protein [Artemisia annua]
MAGDQRFRTLNKPCVLLIGIAGVERFVFKGIASNLVIYLTDVMGMNSSSAVRTVNNWSGFTSMLPLLVAPLVDSYWDRHSTILASSFLYLIGLLALTSTSLSKTNSSSSSSSLFWSLYLISLGQGGYNPSLQAFGADQINTDEDLPMTKNEKNPNKKSMFFQWWYFGICTGSLLGVSIMPNVQQFVGWSLGFAIPTMAMVVSMIMFSCGSRFYSYGHDHDRINDVKSLEKITGAVKCSVSRIIHWRSDEKSSLVELELEDKPFCSKQETETECLTDQKSNNSNHLLKITKVVIGLLPIWTTMLMFAVAFQQPPTFFIKQGLTMKRNIGDSYKIPPATLQSSLTLSIILLMPFYDKIFIPFTRLILRNENGITTMQRIAIGMFLSVIAMISAATVEMKRLETSNEPMSETLNIFTVVGMQEFFYSAVPEGMRTMGIALYTSVFGFGSFLSALLVYLVEYFTTSSDGKGNWFSDDMKEARLDKYYWFLAGTNALSLVVFVVYQGNVMI